MDLIKALLTLLCLIISFGYGWVLAGIFKPKLISELVVLLIATFCVGDMISRIFIFLMSLIDK